MNRQFAYKIAAEALERRRSMSASDLSKSIGLCQTCTLSGPEGQTYFLDVTIDELAKHDGVRVTATVDLGSSFKLERVEEHIDILED